MTETMIELPFPIVGAEIETRDHASALPVGAVVGHNREDSWYRKESDGMWTSLPEDEAGSRVPVEDLPIPCCSEMQVRVLPTLNYEQLEALPVGSQVWWQRPGDGYLGGLYEKVNTLGMCWQRADGDWRNSYMNNCVLVRAEQGRPEVGAALTRAELEALPLGAQVYLTGREVTGVSYVKTGEDGTPWQGFRDGALTDTRFPNTSFGRGEWAVVAYLDLDALRGGTPEVDDDDEADLIVPVTFTQSEVDARVQAAHEAGVAEGRQSSDDRWRERLERFGEAARELADRKGMCEDYDEFAEAWPDMIKSRRKDFVVDLDITVRHRRTVTATSEEDAIEQATSDTGFYEGQDTSMYSEDVEILRIAGTAEEVDD